MTRGAFPMIQHTALRLAAVAGRAGPCGPKPLTPEERWAKGDALLKQMSQQVASTQTFSYTVDETRERVQASGNKTEDHFMRHVTVCRPNALTFSDEGS